MTAVPEPQPTRPEGDTVPPAAKRTLDPETTPEAGREPPAEPATEPDWPTDPRAVLARKRGLPGPAITGGQDPEPSAGRREERRYGSLLLLMVAVIVLAGFVLGIVGVLLGAGTP
ncbi:MAG TPA: hypothetical protein VNO86_04340 [Candidatus Binatia bacterium]|nr:hypothetical protein [Candidatus Binatia bacterium]